MSQSPDAVQFLLGKIEAVETVAAALAAHTLLPYWEQYSTNALHFERKPKLKAPSLMKKKAF
jgi:hypothetical protein